MVTRWFPHLSDTRLRQVTWPQIDKHADYVKTQLAVVSRRRRCGSGCVMSTG